MRTRGDWWLILNAVALGACHPSIAANVVYATGHDIETKAKLAQADLAACKADNARCREVESDLEALVEDGAQLQAAAITAGYQR